MASAWASSSLAATSIWSSCPDFGADEETHIERQVDFDAYEVGCDMPAKPGMEAADIQTPALVPDFDALERNIRKMGDYAKAHGKL
ncbi:hypothetical protein [Sedimentitalea todarodis]|uniref:hypothetical protein n=1 Tax=Sedimentitalea todarodis TaxID=1631240 RepID=UPI0037432779